MLHLLRSIVFAFVCELFYLGVRNLVALAICPFPLSLKYRMCCGEHYRLLFTSVFVYIVFELSMRNSCRNYRWMPMLVYLILATSILTCERACSRNKIVSTQIATSSWQLYIFSVDKLYVYIRFRDGILSYKRLYLWWIQMLTITFRSGFYHSLRPSMF